MVKINVEIFEAEDNEANAVTSSKIFKARRNRDANGAFRFDENGIFSPSIFGRIGKCKCGKTRKYNATCEYCGYRVLDPSNVPNFYIPMIARVLRPTAKFDNFDKDFAQDVKEIITYESYFYDGEVHKYDLENLDFEIDDMNMSKILIGEKALVKMGVSQDWIAKNTIKNISIPHTDFRPIVKTPTSQVTGEMNDSLTKILKLRENILSFGDDDENILFNLAVYQEFYKAYQQFLDKIVEQMWEAKKSAVNGELRSQSLTGAIRSVITNNFEQDEDVVILGSSFLKILYPLVAEECKVDEDEYGFDIYDIDKVNQIMVDKNYLLGINRPPTIGQKSFMAIKPVFEQKFEKRFCAQLNPIIFDGLAGDTDGDSLLFIAIYGKKALKEARKLLPSVNYIEEAYGSIRNGLPEDFEFALKKMKENNQ